jgi:pimeloyl-ACP methyl ester carboxylesterase
VPVPPTTTEPESLVVTLDTGERIHELVWDGVPDGPGVILVHGLAATAWSWAPVARRLAARGSGRVVAVDLRGHGLSDAPRTGYDLGSLAYDVLTVMSSNGWGEAVGGPPAVVAGHGFGAMVAAVTAALQPGSVAGVALVDGGWEDLGEVTGLDAAGLVRTLDEPPEVLSSMDAYLADRAGYDPPTWDADQERAARAAVDEKHSGRVAPVTRPATLRACVDAMFDYRPDEVLGALDRPVLIVAALSGAADDAEARERMLALDDLVRARAATASETRIERFTGAGHNLMRYRADALADALAALIARAVTSGRTPGDPV